VEKDQPETIGDSFVLQKIERIATNNNKLFIKISSGARLCDDPAVHYNLKARNVLWDSINQATTPRSDISFMCLHFCSRQLAFVLVCLGCGDKDWLEWLSASSILH
jgi:hypothetical protein